jgi:hypothetical protein
VTDAKLAEHLSHWGINMLAMQKTEQSVVELNIGGAFNPGVKQEDAA